MHKPIAPALSSVELNDVTQLDSMRCAGVVANFILGAILWFTDYRTRALTCLRREKVSLLKLKVAVAYYNERRQAERGSRWFYGLSCDD
jgi:hypothetical protein